MARRHKLNRSGSERSFSRHGMSVHPKNVLGGVVMRGGIRL